MDFFLAARINTPSAHITENTAKTTGGRCDDGEYHDTEAAL